MKYNVYAFFSLFATYGKSASWFFFVEEETRLKLATLLQILTRYPRHEVKVTPTHTHTHIPFCYVKDLTVVLITS